MKGNHKMDKQPTLEITFTVTFSDDGWRISSDVGSNLEDRLFDAFYLSGIDGYRFLDSFAEEASELESREDAAELFSERLGVLKYLQDGGFIGANYAFVFDDKRSAKELAEQ